MAIILRGRRRPLKRRSAATVTGLQQLLACELKGLGWEVLHRIINLYQEQMNGLAVLSVRGEGDRGVVTPPLLSLIFTMFECHFLFWWRCDIMKSVFGGEIYLISFGLHRSGECPIVTVRKRRRGNRLDFPGWSASPGPNIHAVTPRSLASGRCVSWSHQTQMELASDKRQPSLGTASTTGLLIGSSRFQPQGMFPIPIFVKAAS